jgi:hypothetical protein
MPRRKNINRESLLATSAFAGTDQAAGLLSKLNERIGLFSIVHLAARENLFFAFVSNAVGVPLAAGVLFPTF